MPSKEPVEKVFREHSGRLLAWLIRILGDFDLAEEALQEAYLIALRRWPSAGVPENPRAWLAVVARNCATDRLRRERQRPEVEQQMHDLQEPPEDPGALEDEQLRLVFTCCHPALSVDARVALTLRTVSGLSVSEIASAFLVSEAALARRLVRAKHKIRTARIPYEIPTAERLEERLEGVLGVIYLVFNEGYLASDGPTLVRDELCDEAIRLARVLTTLMPGEPEVRSLLALLLFTDSRRLARVDESGEPVLLPAQDRARWDQVGIREGVKELGRAGRHHQAGRYYLQAAIAAEHALATSADATNWSRIARLYDLLVDVAPSPVTRLNRLVAVSIAHDPSFALEELESLRESLAGYPYFHSARADILMRLGRQEAALAAYRQALAVTTNAAQRRAIERTLAEPTRPLGLPPHGLSRPAPDSRSSSPGGDG